MNMSASFSVWIAPKPAFSQLNSFISKFTTRVSEKCKPGRKLYKLSYYSHLPQLNLHQQLFVEKF